MVDCRLCDDSSGSCSGCWLQMDVDGYRQVQIVGPKRAFRYATETRSFPQTCSCSCLSIATSISTMSTKAKLTLAATSLGAIGIIVFVHHGQKVEKAVSHFIFSSTFLR